MILYEFPFNERIRTYLRLEQMMQRLSAMIARENAHDHHFALLTLFEIIEIASRADLKSDVLRDIEKQKNLMNGFRGNPAIQEASLNVVIEQLESTYSALNQQQGKAGSQLLDNDWLMSIRSRSVIPGGTCSFDLPSYHAWLQQPAQFRQHQLFEWARPIEPLFKAITLLLQMLRESGTPQQVIAQNGQLQQALPQSRSFQLARVFLDEQLDVIPEISGNRLMLSVRLTRQSAQHRPEPFRQDVAFALTLCTGG